MKWFQHQLLRLHHLALQYPKSCVVMTFAVLFSSFALFPQLNFELRIFDTDDPAFPSSQDLKKMKNDFEDGNQVILFFSTHTPSTKFTHAQLCAIKKWYETQRRENSSILRAASPFDDIAPTREGEKLWYKRRLNLDCAHPLSHTVDLSMFDQSPWNGYTVTSHDIGIAFTFKDLEEKGRFGSFDPQVIGNIYHNAQENLASHTIRVHLAGKAAPQWFIKDALRKDGLIPLITALVLLALLRFFLGTWKSGVLFLVSIVMSYCIVLGAMALTRTPVDTLSNNLFLMLCIAGLEDFLFVSLWQKRYPEKNPLEAYKVMIIPGFFTSLTTFLGFLSLATADIDMIQRFGVFAALGAAVEWMITYLSIPAFLSITSKYSWTWVRSSTPRTDHFIHRLVSWTPPRSATILALALFIGGLFSLPFLSFRDSVETNFPQGHPFRESLAHAKSTRQWQTLVNIVFHPSVTEDTQAHVLRTMAQLPEVTRVDDFVRVTSTMGQSFPKDIQNLISREMEISRIARNYVSKDSQKRATLFLRDLEVDTVRTVESSLEALCHKKLCTLVGEPVVFSSISAKVVNDLAHSLGSGMILVAIILWLLSSAHTTSTRLRLILSAIWSPIVAMGLIVVLKLPVNVVTCIFPAVLVGLTGDNAVQFLFADQKQNLDKGIEERGPMAVVLSLMLCLGSLSFLFLTMIPLKILGLMFFLGSTINLIGDVWLLKGLLEPRKKGPQEVHPKRLQWISESPHT